MKYKPGDIGHYNPSDKILILKPRKDWCENVVCVRNGPNQYDANGNAIGCARAQHNVITLPTLNLKDAREYDDCCRMRGDHFITITHTTKKQLYSILSKCRGPRLRECIKEIIRERR